MTICISNKIQYLCPVATATWCSWPVEALTSLYRDLGRTVTAMSSRWRACDSISYDVYTRAYDGRERSEYSLFRVGW